MAVNYLEENRLFQLDTNNTSYIIGIVDEENFIGHVYYGKKVRQEDSSYLLRISEGPLCQVQITETGYHSMTSFQWNIPEMVWEITEKVPLQLKHQRGQMVFL